MRIRTVKKMNLPELIQYVWDEQIKSTYDTTQYHSNLNTVVEVDMSGQVSVHGRHYGNEVYTVPVTEELTEETLISGMTGVYYNRQLKELDLTVMQRTAIKYQLGDDVEDILLAIYVGPTLIWSKEHGIPESGVLEVGVE